MDTEDDVNAERVYAVTEPARDPKVLAFQEWDGRVGLRAAPLLAPDPCFICGTPYSACDHNHQGAKNV